MHTRLITHASMPKKGKVNFQDSAFQGYSFEGFQKLCDGFANFSTEHETCAEFYVRIIASNKGPNCTSLHSQGEPIYRWMGLKGSL